MADAPRAVDQGRPGSALAPRRTKVAALVGAALALAAGPAWAVSYPPDYAWGGYRYDGRDVRYDRATVTLESAHLVSGHVAVWSGVADDHSWLQAGVALRVRDTQPFRYVEIRRAGRVRLVRLGAGEALTVTLRKVRREWELRACGRTFRIRLAHAVGYAGAESWDKTKPNAVSGQVRTEHGTFSVALAEA